MKNNFQALYDFIDRATKSRKYPENTAKALRAALKLYEPILNEDELNSLEKFTENFEQITSSMFNKNANRFSASSLPAYKSRAQKVLNDYSKYADPAKMSNWSPKKISRSVKVKKVDTENLTNIDKAPLFAHNTLESIPENMHKIELALRSDTKFIVIVPRDINKNEAKTLKTIIDSLVTGGEEGV